MSSMKDKLKKIIYHAYKGDASKIQEITREALATKTSRALETQKKRVASKMMQNDES